MREEAGLIGYVNDFWEEAKTARAQKEDRWLTAYWNTLGQYSPAVQAQWRKHEAEMPAQSRIFANATYPKVRAGVSRAQDVLSSWDFELEAMPEETLPDEEVKERIEKAEARLKKWYTIGEFATQVMIRFLWDAAWSGNGFIRTPVAAEHVQVAYSRDPVTGSVQAVAKREEYPGYEVVPIWHVYPDPQAKTLQDGRGWIILHKLSPSELRANAKALGWDMDVVDNMLKRGPDGGSNEEKWESSVRSAKEQNTEYDGGKLFRVKEFWGSAKVEWLKDHGVDVGELADLDLTDDDYVECCVTVTGVDVLKAQLNPYYPAPYRPMVQFQWDRSPENFWGVGVPEQMEDSQRMLNGAYRVYYENKALAANAMFEINVEDLLPGQDVTQIYPGKKWLLRPGARDALRPVLVPDVSASLLEMASVANEIASRVTGETDQSLGYDAPENASTATGQSILASNSSRVSKARLRRLDEVIEQVVEWHLRWLNEFSELEDEKVLATVKAAGILKTAQAQELVSLRLQAFTQLLPTFISLPKEGPEGTALEGIDLTKVLDRYLDVLEMEDVAISEEEQDARKIEMLQGLMQQAQRDPEGVLQSLVSLGGGGAGAGAVQPGVGSVASPNGSGTLANAGGVGDMFTGNPSPATG